MVTRFTIRLAIALLVFGSVVPVVYGAEVTDRSLVLSTSAPSASANYTFNFTVPSSDIIQSFSAQVCTTASNTCTAPAGFDASGATLLSQPTGFGANSGWTDESVTGELRMTNSTNATAPGSAQAVTFSSVINPSTTNESFYVRLTTYSDANYTTAIDTGVVAASTAEQITLTGFVPPILTFCVGVTVSGDCSTAAGNSIDFGTFSPSTTSSGTSQMRASTNAGDGYAITINGTTLSSGSNTIPALASPTASQAGTSQFGVNLRNNTNPDVGADPSGTGVATVAADYNTVDAFMFQDGDTVAQSVGPTNANTFTVSYMTNIEPRQAAGNYTTTITYICTATF